MSVVRNDDRTVPVLTIALAAAGQQKDRIIFGMDFIPEAKEAIKTAPWMSAMPFLVSGSGGVNSLSPISSIFFPIALQKFMSTDTKQTGIIPSPILDRLNPSSPACFRHPATGGPSSWPIRPKRYPPAAFCRNACQKWYRLKHFPLPTRYRRSTVIPRFYP
ncbi:MAG: hypothetical protein WA151_18060 [Desulfatirhabdiaceae bacterium]